MNSSIHEDPREFVRLFLPDFRCWVAAYEEIGGGFHVSLKERKVDAAVFVGSAPTVVNIVRRFCDVKIDQATYADWIEAGHIHQQAR